MPVFAEKPPLASSNCHKTVKNASIVIKLGISVDWSIDFVTACSMLNLLLPWQRGGISKVPKITILHRFFHSKLISKRYYFLLDGVRDKGFSTLITCCLKINQRPFPASHKSKFFLSDEGGQAPLQTPWQRGAHPPSGTPLRYLFDGGRRRKRGQFFKQHFLKWN